MSINPEIIRSGILLFFFLLLFVLFVVKTQDKVLNWSVFFATLWITCLLAIVNYYCVSYGLWAFTDAVIPSILIPYDLFFVWVLGWSVLPVYVFKGKYPVVIALILILLDLVLMPLAQNLGYLILHEHWVLGELVLVAFVWLPGYLWAGWFYNKTHTGLRALLQMGIMFVFLFIGIPIMALVYEQEHFIFWTWDWNWVQFIFICTFPSLVAVQNLVTIGKGTPFPFDATTYLVQRGVYAYCRNPIQWSCTILFIPLSLYYESYILAVGFFVSIFYVIGTANMHEKEDMVQKFGHEWTTYMKVTPAWYFLWKPKAISKGTIYFKQSCKECENTRDWFLKRNPINLDIKYAQEETQNTFLQVTFKDHTGQTYKSVKAIGMALEHIHLGYACLGWFIQLPGICWFLQVIIDALGYGPDDEVCSI